MATLPVRGNATPSVRDWRIRRKDGSFLEVEVSSRRLTDGRRLGVARDVTARRTAEHAERLRLELAREELARSERDFEVLVAGIVDYALIMQSPQGVVARWNAGAERIKGYSAADIIGSHFSVFYTAEDRAAGLPAEILKTATENGRFEAEGWRVRKDGSLFWANVVLDGLYDEERRLIGFAKITRDITERRNAQLELQRAQERLAHAQKMDALGQLTGGVAHDFNNLLMVVGGQAELLQGGVADPARAARSLKAIAEAARRGQELTKRLLAFSRRQRLHPTPVSLTARMVDLKPLLESSLGNGVALKIDCPNDLWTVEIDVNAWEVAVLNMTVNAATPCPMAG